MTPGRVQLHCCGAGGWTRRALRRAAERGNGWYGWGLDHEWAGAVIARLRTAMEGTERDPSLGRLEISITPRGSVDMRSVERYAALGVDRLTLPVRSALEESDLLRFVDDVGTDLIGRL